MKTKEVFNIHPEPNRLCKSQAYQKRENNLNVNYIFLGDQIVCNSFHKQFLKIFVVKSMSEYSCYKGPSVGDPETLHTVL